MESIKPVAWDAVPETAMPALSGTVLRRFLSGDTLTIARVRFAPGSETSVHAHENEQYTLVVSGSLIFSVAGEKVVVRAGEVLHLPSNVPHGAFAEEAAEVIDVFSPVRADWLAEHPIPDTGPGA